MVEVGQKLPDAEVLLVGEDGQEVVRIADYLASKKVAIFAMPGAFTSTCSSSHLPNVIRHKDGLDEKGVDDVVILVVNDPFVVREWAKHSGFCRRSDNDCRCRICIHNSLGDEFLCRSHRIL